MSETSRGTPTVTSAIYNKIRKVLESEVETQFVAEVIKYYPDTGQADVQGIMLLPDVNGEAKIVVDLEGVPVARESGPEYISYGDITKADVLVVIPKIDTSNYIFGENKDAEGEPLFSLNGAICTPLATDHKGVWKDIPLKQAGTRVSTGNSLWLGDDTNEVVGLLTDVIAELRTAIAQIQLITVTTATVVSGPPNNSAAFIPIDTALGVIETKLAPFKP